MMKLANDEECDSLARISRFIFVVLFCLLRARIAGTHTYFSTISLSSLRVCGRDNSLYRENKLRQARLAAYTEVWIYVSL